MRSVVRWMVILLFSLMGNAQAATNITPGVLYQGGTRLSQASLGVEFVVPAGWRALLPAGAEMMIMEPADATARMLITAIPDSTEASVQATMMKTVALDMTSQVAPFAPPQRQAPGYFQRYQVQGFNPKGLEAVGYARLGPNGTAFYALVLTPKNDRRFQNIGATLINSVAFSQGKPKTQQADQSNWEQQVKGRSLVYRRTVGGGSVVKRLSLCSDYTFVYSDSDNYGSSNTAADFSMTSRLGQRGRWQIRGNQLVLSWANGSSTQHSFSRQYVKEYGEWGTFVDNKRWFNDRNRDCN